MSSYRSQREGWQTNRGRRRGRGRTNATRRDGSRRQGKTMVDPRILEGWKKEQRSLKSTLILQDDFNMDEVRLIGGLDISFFKKDKDRAIVCLSVFEYPSLKHVKNIVHDVKLTAPYVPGYLAFREVDHYLAALNDLKKSDPNLVPDLMVVDGNGILHYGGLGSASHFGVLAGIPTIGVAKKLLCVDGLQTEVVAGQTMTMCEQPGDYFFLEGRRYGRLGACMLTADGEEPIYISIGHRISLETSINVVANCLQNGEREPTPTLHADKVGRAHVKQEIEKQRKAQQRKRQPARTRKKRDTWSRAY